MPEYKGTSSSQPQPEQKAQVPDLTEYDNLWKRDDVPKTGWVCLGVIDLGAPVGVCEMCGHQIIRYVHTMHHPDYRKLSEKYEVSMTEVSRHGKDESWREERRKYQEKAYAKTLDVLIKGQQNRIKRLQTITDKILDKIEESVDQMDAKDLMAYRQITAAIKDIKEIQMLKSEADMREQEARINKLRKDAEDSDKSDSSVNIVMEDNLKEFST